MKKHLSHLIEKIETAPLTLGAWVITFFAIVAVRMGIENLVTGLPYHFADHYFYFFTDFFFSFAFSLFVIILTFCWAGQISFSRAANLGLFTFLVIWLPPVIDEIISRGQGLWSFYSFDSLSGLWGRYLTFFGENPEVAITYGVRVEVGLAVVFVFLYTLLKSGKWWRALVAALFLYTALFVILALPSFIAIPLLGFEKGFSQVSETDIAAFILTPEHFFGLPAPSIESVLNIKVTLLFAPLLTALVALITFLFYRTYFFALYHNARLPQVFYHVGLLLVGGALVYVYGTSTFQMDIFHWSGLFTLMVAVSCAWLASVVVNDLHDTSIDTLTNPRRPLIENTIPRDTYVTMGWLFFFTSIIFAAIVSTQAALLLVIYQSLAYVYSASPLRLKRFPLMATSLAAAASLSVFFAGFIVFSVEKNISTLPWSVPTLLFIAYAFLLPIKDFKDIPGDKVDGVITLPVLLGEVWAKRFIGAVLLLVFMASVFVFDVPHLFFLAFFFGTLAYWLLQASSIDHRYFKYQHLAHWYIALVSCYGFFLALELAGR